MGDHVVERRVVVEFLLARIALGAVEPYLVDLAVLGQDFIKRVEEERAVIGCLVLERREVLACPVVVGDQCRDGAFLLGATVAKYARNFLVGVGGGHVESHLHPIFMCGVGELLHHITLATLPWGGCHRVGGVARRVRHESIVVLDRQDRVTESVVTQSLNPAVSVEVRGIEPCRVLGAVAPLLVVESVDAEVHECGLASFLPFELGQRGANQG